MVTEQEEIDYIRRDAQNVYRANLLRLDGMGHIERRYMGGLASVNDPLTDDIECAHDETVAPSEEVHEADFRAWARELGPLALAPLRDPFSEWRPWSGKSGVALTHDIICLHTMVGTLAGSWAWASGAGRPYWHYGIGGGGAVWQCQDLRYRSAANLNGNWHVIPIETSDMKEGFFADTWQNPPWTDSQVNSIVKLVAWLCIAFNIPPVLIPDTRSGRRGIAYHRQGIVPQLVSGGEKWSNANGKSCPAARVNQLMNSVIPRVRAIVLGGATPTLGWDEMATKAEIKAALKETLDDQFSTPGSDVRIGIDGILKKADNLGDPALGTDIASRLTRKLNYRAVPHNWNDMTVAEREAYGVHWVVLNMYKFRIAEGTPLDDNAKIVMGTVDADRIPKDILDAMPTLAVVS